MTSSNGNIFRITGPLGGGIKGSPVDSPYKGKWRRTLLFSTNGSAKNRDAGYLRCHCAHYDVTVMSQDVIICWLHQWRRRLFTYHLVNCKQWVLQNCNFLKKLWYILRKQERYTCLFEYMCFNAEGQSTGFTTISLHGFNDNYKFAFFMTTQRDNGQLHATELHVIARNKRNVKEDLCLWDFDE